MQTKPSTSMYDIARFQHGVTGVALHRRCMCRVYIRVKSRAAQRSVARNAADTLAEQQVVEVGCSMSTPLPRCPVPGCGEWKHHQSRRRCSQGTWPLLDSNRDLLLDS